ncbi:uncharacterized protein LOC143891416 [Tasmannia lanceolata]|uniref:uncharacterized protein LOC143891416 n=1 Tax=Tasmannia lanceolata TaxID=3420 RepID=UPI004062EED8
MPEWNFPIMQGIEVIEVTLEVPQQAVGYPIPDSSLGLKLLFAWLVTERWRDEAPLQEAIARAKARAMIANLAAQGVDDVLAASQHEDTVLRGRLAMYEGFTAEQGMAPSRGQQEPAEGSCPSLRANPNVEIAKDEEEDTEGGEDDDDDDDDYYVLDPLDLGDDDSPVPIRRAGKRRMTTTSSSPKRVRNPLHRRG